MYYLSLVLPDDHVRKFTCPYSFRTRKYEWMSGFYGPCLALCDKGSGDILYLLILKAFKPMAECAKKIIQDNGFQDKIQLIPKRSTDITVGEGT